MTRLFLQLAIKEIEAKGRGTTQLSNNSLRNIAAELNARTGEVITLKQCKNRYGVLKRDWQAWILLADSRRGATGLGMNPVTGTFTAPDHFWANLIAVNTFSIIGAIDRTHVMIRCKKKEDEKRFFSRKGYATQNIMAVCDFDLTFVFASAGWEGIYHDYSIFKRCVLNPRCRFPKREPGKSCLVDAGYHNRLGFLAPYKGYWYHQAEFRRGQRQPCDDREHFNRAHSSLRSIIERTFGVWKNRFGFLALMLWYEMPTQVDLVLASMAIHNYIRRDRELDDFFAPVSSAYEYAFEDLPDEGPELEDKLDERDDIVDEDNVPEMNDVRNNIRSALRRLRRRGNRAA